MYVACFRRCSVWFKGFRVWGFRVCAENMSLRASERLRVLLVRGTVLGNSGLGFRVYGLGVDRSGLNVQSIVISPCSPCAVTR